MTDLTDDQLIDAGVTALAMGTATRVPVVAQVMAPALAELRRIRTEREQLAMRLSIAIAERNELAQIIARHTDPGSIHAQENATR